MQRGSINCPSHGSVVMCEGQDGAEVLAGTCPYGNEVITMVPQSLSGPFQKHWDPHNHLNASPNEAAVESLSSVETVIDLEQLVLDTAAAHAKIDALAAKVDALHELLAAGTTVHQQLSKA